ncbi:hypothetical protein DFH09DRAFT_1466376 [Mycena vulgaris]|nr:hypothetical protein DFH09DRAFT_1466376 [Mycena vulgaris]
MNNGAPELHVVPFVYTPHAHPRAVVAFVPSSAASAASGAHPALVRRAQRTSRSRCLYDPDDRDSDERDERKSGRGRVVLLCAARGLCLGALGTWRIGQLALGSGAGVLALAWHQRWGYELLLGEASFSISDRITSKRGLKSVHTLFYPSYRSNSIHALPRHLETWRGPCPTSYVSTGKFRNPGNRRFDQGNITPTYANQGIQVGESWTTELLRETYTPHLTQDRRFDRILTRLQRGGWSVCTFLEKLFANPGPSELFRSQKHAQMASAFLRGSKNEMVESDHIVELMYSSKDSAPKAIRKTAGGASVEKDGSQMARYRLREWAIRKVEGYVSTASNEVSGKDGGFHLPTKSTWDFIHGFSFAKAIRPNEEKAAVLLRILAAAALPAVLTRPGGKSKGPSSGLRKLAGIWLFANNASSSIFTVLSRIGLSSSYTTVLRTPRALSASAQLLIRLKARKRAFLLIYDNAIKGAPAFKPVTKGW